MTVVSRQPTRIVRINGVDAIMSEHSRSMGGKPPALVRTYLIQNDDLLHTVTISYRETEGELWAADLDKVLTTFKFAAR